MHEKKAGWGTFFIACVAAAFIFGGGADKKSPSTPNHGPKPTTSAVCNEYFKGGC